MAWTTEQSEANAALNAQEFANRQITIKGDGPPSGVAPFLTEYWDQTTVPFPTQYRQMSPGVGSGWIEVENGGSGTSVAGAVFITDLVPTGTGNVGSKIFDGDNTVLESAVADTDFVTVSVLAITGNSTFRPVITVLGQPVALIQNEDQTVWTGSVEIDRSGATTITAQHGDGAIHTVAVTEDAGPVIESAKFIGGYPSGQTELKAGDTYDVSVETDSPMSAVEIQGNDAAVAEIIPLGSPTTNATVSVTIKDQGNTTQAFGVVLRAINANGSAGDYFDTSSSGNTDGEHTVNLNNLHPEIEVTTVNYPAGQQALKDSENATIEHTIDNFDTVLYSSPNGEINIPDPTIQVNAKSVARQAGTYNVASANVEIAATRAANGATSATNLVVAIAHQAAVLTVDEQQTRLRSGGNQGTVAQNHEIKITSDQLLLAAPQISAPVGTLQGVMVDLGTGLVFSQDLRVHDDDEKGLHAFVLNSATNLAGIPTGSFSGEVNYTLGGFVKRTIAVAAFEKEVALGTEVADVTKVVARDKDLILQIYVPDLTQGLKHYTVTNGDELPNPTGNTFHWLDSQAINNNSTGLATITIEETV